MNLREILDQSSVVLDLGGATKREILERLSAPLAGINSAIGEGELVEVLLKREQDSTTAIADGIALPHGRVVMKESPEDVVAGFGRSREGLDFDSVDGKPTHIFFVLVSPEDQPSLHMRWMAHLARLLKNPDLRKALVEAESPEEILAAIEAEEQAQSSQQ